MYLYNPDILAVRKSKNLPYSAISFVLADRADKQACISQDLLMNWEFLTKSSKLRACLLCILEKNFQRMLHAAVDLRYILKILSVSTDATETIWVNFMG